MSEAFPRYMPPSAGAIRPRGLAQLWCDAVALAGRPHAQFMAIVVAPTAAAALYFGLIAAPQFVSHSEYIVRGVDAHRSGGLAQLLNTFGVSRAADETSAIESFLKSREIVEKVNQRVDLRAVYGSGEADWFSRFPRLWEHDSFESLFNYTRGVFDITKDSTSGVTRLDVSAFDPRSAQTIAVAMLEAASDMANGLNGRAQADLVESSRQELDRARDEVVKAQSDLTAYRNQILLVDPLAFAGAMLQEIGSLSLERARALAQLSEKQNLSPNSPGIDSVKASIAALERRVEEERGKLAGDNSALAGKVADYERMTLTRELAEKHYASALVSLETAEAEAQRKRVYIEEIVTPNLPDEATAPLRLRSVLATFVVSFIAFSILWILSVGSKDHAQ
jgi:capsular polysaccharide transport system permease protein